MATLTPKYSLPAPTPDEPADGPVQILALGQSVETLLSVGTVDMTAGTLHVKTPVAAADAVPKSYVDGKVAGWVTVPQFATNWTIWPGYPVKYCRDPDGVVHMIGLVQCTTTAPVNARIFTLPAGFRPSQTLHMATLRNGAPFGFGIAPDGQVVPKQAYTPARLWLSVVCTFKAEQ